LAAGNEKEEIWCVEVCVEVYLNFDTDGFLTVCHAEFKVRFKVEIDDLLHKKQKLRHIDTDFDTNFDTETLFVFNEL